MALSYLLEQDPNKNPRAYDHVDTGLYLLDRENTSFLSILGLLQNYIKNRSEDRSFKDFYEGGVGETILELLSGQGEYDAYMAITARREAYLFECQQKSSAIGIASTIGYSAYRGKNVHLVLTFTPSEDFTVQPFDVIGTNGSYSVVSLQEKTFRYGESADIEVALGNVKSENVDISDAKTYEFRFINSNISEDYQLKLNTTVVPTSRDIYDLMRDKFLVLSNSVGGVDVKYLNRYPPQNWLPMTRYTFWSYVNPNYSWRANWQYKQGQCCCRVGNTEFNPVLFKCISDNGGYSSINEPQWQEIVGSIVSDGDLTWECIGTLPKPVYFKAITPGVGKSGNLEPVWPIEVSEKVYNDGDMTWLCTDTYGVSQYPYTTGDILTLDYIELANVSYDSTSVKLDKGKITVVTLSSSYEDSESIESIRTNAPLYHETKYVIRGRNDYAKILKELTPSVLDVSSFDKSPAVVQLSYVKNHTTNLWRMNQIFSKGDKVLSSNANGMIYTALNAGRGGTSNRGLSGVEEPIWNTDITNHPTDAFTYDNQLKWLAYNRTGTPPQWQANTYYSLGDIIQPTAANGLMYELVVVYSEPNWPTELGSTVVDNEVTWQCTDSIYLGGYDATYRVQERQYSVGDFVVPVVPNGYYYRCKTAGTTGVYEPNWPTTICFTVPDGSVVWECYDRTDAEKYVKNHVLENIESYRPYGVMPPEIVDPSLVFVNLNIELRISKTKDLDTIYKDIDEILTQYQRVLGINLTTHDLENEIESKLWEYVKVARITSINSSKVRTWAPGKLIRIKDVVEPSVPNGYVYIANVIVGGASYAYTQWTDRAYSGLSEPNWPTKAGSTIEDNNIVWEMRNLSELTAPSLLFWSPDTIYYKDNNVLPNVENTKVYAKVKSIKSGEPVWPLRVDGSVLDGKIFWVALNPEEQITPLGWNEYYMFGRTITIVRG